MNIDEAMSAAMLGDRVTHARLGRDTFISYDFGTNAGYKSKHMKHFGEWASCSFIASDVDFAADWYVETREICGECFGFKASQCRCERQTRWHGNELARSITEAGKVEVRKLASAWAGVTVAKPPIVLTKPPTIIGDVPKPSAWAGVKIEPPALSEDEQHEALCQTKGKDYADRILGARIRKPEPKRDAWGRIVP